MATERQLQVMARHYLIAALWADCEEGTHPRETRQARAYALDACRAFVAAIGPLFDEAMARHAEGYGKHSDCGNDEPACAAMGHDLWLTSRGHGTGFWGRDALARGDLGERLSSFCGWRAKGNGPGEPCAYQYRGWFYIQG